jgi:hypothetical protein
MLPFPDERTNRAVIETHFLPELAAEGLFEGFTRANPTAREDPERVAALRWPDAKQEDV